MNNTELCLAHVGRLWGHPAARALPVEYSNTWEWALKTKLHIKVCKNPPKEAEVRKPKVKSMGPLGPGPLEAYDTKRSFTILQ